MAWKGRDPQLVTSQSYLVTRLTRNTKQCDNAARFITPALEALPTTTDQLRNPTGLKAEPYG